jgi:hypothetical protein
MMTESMKAPSAFARVFGLGYLFVLRQQQQRFALWPGLPPCAILYLCLLSVLSVHVPALWSGRVNLVRCVAQLEKVLLYFAVLQTVLLTLWGQGNEEDNTGPSPTAYTCAAMCLGWYVWNSVGRDWLPTPASMKLSLVVYFAGCVPLLWLGAPSEAMPVEQPLTTACLCDVSLVCLACVLHAYGRLWELMGSMLLG